MKKLLHRIKASANQVQANEIIRDFLQKKTHKKIERILSVIACYPADSADIEIVFKTESGIFYCAEVEGATVTRLIEV